MVRTKFHNFKALKKTLKKFGNDELAKAGRPAYVKASKRIHRKAQLNTSSFKKPTGKLKRRIRWIGETKKRISRGSLLNYTVYSNSIQDMLLTYGVPEGNISGDELTKRSRTFRGKRHRPKPSGDFSKGDKRRERHYKRNWAWGKRDANPFMTEGQDFDKVLTDTAQETANNIFEQFDKMFSSFAK
jgi:hypothetical protein